MENKASGTQRINPAEVDGAIDEALTRVEQADELSQDDLDKANGGTIPPTSGFLEVE
jgi:hypothetical protein